jgi:NAD(P)-dependent dehydrogenase (short-subunit alcohol dehydrogenase family)
MTGKVAVITGGSQGIGAGLVTGYRGRGWAVAASALTIEPSEESDLLTVAGDIADPVTADRIADAALDRFGRIDTLINNAGVFVAKPFTDYTADDYALVTGVNLAGFFWLTQRKHRTWSGRPCTISSTRPAAHRRDDERERQRSYHVEPLQRRQSQVPGDDRRLGRLSYRCATVASWLSARSAPSPSRPSSMPRSPPPLRPPG